MRQYVPDVIAWKRGFERAHDRLEQLRRKEIRESDIVKDAPTFELAFKSAIQFGVPEKTLGLTKLERVLFGVDR